MACVLDVFCSAIIVRMALTPSPDSGYGSLMYIRRTSIKSRRTGEPYYTYRLVESVRNHTQVRQRTLLNLGRHFRVPRAQWGPLAQRIEALLSGQLDLMPDALDPQWESVAQEYAARLLRDRGEMRFTDIRNPGG